MNSEIDAKFLDIDIDDIRAKLSNIGAELVKPEVLMRRVVFDLGSHSFVRVRDEGDKIVMTYKNIVDRNSILGTKEINVTVENYDDTIQILKSCGLRVKSHEESKREIWKYKDAEICIDTWPWIPTFIEIEAPSEDSVWQTAQKLGFDKAQAQYGPVDTTYAHYYGIKQEVFNQQTPEVLFDMDPPEWVKKD
jgi:adenylate cyclase class 2